MKTKISSYIFFILFFVECLYYVFRFCNKNFQINISYLIFYFLSEELRTSKYKKLTLSGYLSSNVRYFFFIYVIYLFQCKSNDKLQKYVYFLEYQNNKSKIVFIWCPFVFFCHRNVFQFMYIWWFNIWIMSSK